MHEISPGGFALALGILVVIWVFLPDKARGPLALLLILGALILTKAPVHYVNRFFGMLK